MLIIINEFPTHIAKTNNKVAPNKMVKINNQTIYNGSLNRFSRNIVMNNLHNYILKQIKPYKKGFLNESRVYPIDINLIFYTVENHGSISMRNHKICWKYPKKNYLPNWDIENLATIWIKAINDSLVIGGFIPDDNITYINKISYKYKKVKNLEDRKIEIYLDE